MRRRALSQASSHRRGSAMLAALAMVVVLASVTAMASRGARSSAAVVSNARADAIARAMSESGVLSAVARVQARLEAAPDSAARTAAFDALLADAARPDGSPAPFTADTLADGVFATALVNVSARFDVNSGDEEGLTRLFATVAPSADARRVATRLSAQVRRDLREGRNATRDSLATAFLGRAVAPRRGAFESLDAVADFVGADAPWLGAVAPLLTVDGDGRIDRRHAAPAVLRAASGSLVDEPTRLLIIARGWQAGHVLTREVQAVYAVDGAELKLVRWREQIR